MHDCPGSPDRQWHNGPAHRRRIRQVWDRTFLLLCHPTVVPITKFASLGTLPRDPVTKYKVPSEQSTDSQKVELKRPTTPPSSQRPSTGPVKALAGADSRGRGSAPPGARHGSRGRYANRPYLVGAAAATVRPGPTPLAPIGLVAATPRCDTFAGLDFTHHVTAHPYNCPQRTRPQLLIST